MGKPKSPLKVKLFVAFMYNSAYDYNPMINILVEKWGECDFFFGPIPFNFSDYYQKEMGKQLNKVYFTFKKFISREKLSEIKLFTNSLEEKYSIDGKRIYNIDPGYLAADKLVLATTKDFFHRIYLSDGIFAEVTLHYRRNCWRYFSWTYPDYRTQEFLDFITKVRANYMKEIRKVKTKEEN